MTDDPGWRGWIGDGLERIRSEHRWRSPRSFDALGPRGTVDGRRVVSFASNDYLGLTQHPEVVAAAHRALDRWGAGSGAARLVVGGRPVHDELESALAAWRGAERAVLFPTGFAANLGVLTTFGHPGSRIVSDELNHASIIDGARLARAEVEVYPHRDLAALEALLADDPRPTIVATDTVFSMDGDLAEVDGIYELAARHGALVVLDEAHAVLGPETTPPDDVTVIRVGTLSKTLGSLGGYVVGSAPVADLLVNRARSYIFTTATSPADAAAARAAVGVCAGPEGDTLRRRLRENIDVLAPGHPSPILPVVVGEERAAVEVSRALEDEGFLVPAIRPPTVAPGTSRLRVAISAAHSRDECEALARRLAAAGLRPGAD